MTMVHEGPDLHMVKLFNLNRKFRTHNGNEWWIFTNTGYPVETWSKFTRAEHFRGEASKAMEQYHVPPRTLFRCVPGIGFIPQVTPGQDPVRCGCQLFRSLLPDA